MISYTSKMLEIIVYIMQRNACLRMIAMMSVLTNGSISFLMVLNGSY
jgi:hypothetical protein